MRINKDEMIVEFQLPILANEKYYNSNREEIEAIFAKSDRLIRDVHRNKIPIKNFQKA